MSTETGNIESSRQRRNFKTFVIVAIVLAAIYFYNSGNKSGSTYTNTSNSVPTSNTTWVPSGYNAWSSDSNIAYKYVDNPKCTYSDGICVAINVVTERGCPTSLYGEISLSDKAGIQYDYTNDSISSLPAGSIGELTFNILDYERFNSFNLTKISCY